MKQLQYTISNEKGFNGPGLSEKDWYIGGPNTKIAATKERRHNRNWRADNPTEETQVRKFYDCYGCLTYSGQSAIETDMEAQYHDGNTAMEKVMKTLGVLDENDKPDFSEDFNVLLSGTIPYVGNSQANVNESFRKDSLIPGSALIFTENMTKEQYINPNRITVQHRLMAAKTKSFIDIQWERLQYVRNQPYAKPEDLYDALGYWPIQVIVAAERNLRNGLLSPVANYTYDHAQFLVEAEWKKSFTVCDTYQNFRGDTASFYKKYSWDYAFGWPLHYDVQLVKGVEDIESFLKEYQGKFVQGSNNGIYKIEGNKKRAFTHWFDYVLFDGGKGVAKRVSDSILVMIDDGPNMVPQESPNWEFVSEKYQILKEMAQPDNIKRLVDLISTGQAKKNQTWTAKPTLPPTFTTTAQFSLLDAIADFIKRITKK